MELPKHQVLRERQQGYEPHQPPPMREVTKGWFTMREEAKTIEELRSSDERR